MRLIDELKLCGPWFDALQDQHDRLNRIDDFLLEKETCATVYPPRGQRLAALSNCSLEKVSVLVVAQDPYPGEDHGEPNAMGLALSVKEGVRLPASLKNIYKELSRSLGITPSLSGDLRPWANQGVLLWNVLLTVDAAILKVTREANGHCLLKPL
jgi:uracil-DNA glycosylase